MATALAHTGQPKKAIESLNRIKKANQDIRDMVRHQRMEILKEMSKKENL
jgi:hypothetical protein